MDKVKSYRSIYFNDERKWKSNNLLDDITQVGIKKAMGHICVTQDMSLKKLKKDFSNKLNYYLDDEIVPTFHVGDEKMIQTLINKNINILIKNNWKLSAKEVFYKVCVNDISHDDNKELYHFITDLFNSWCLFCEEPVWVFRKDSKTRKIPMSKFPFDPDLDYNG